MKILEIGKRVLKIEADSILGAIQKIGKDFEEIVNIISQSENPIIITGMGKSGFISKKIAATLTSTGTPAIFLHPIEALHGDMGIVSSESIIILISYSGETKEIKELLNYLKKLNVILISLVGNKDSFLARQSNFFIDCSIKREASELVDCVPSASSTLALAVGDAIAISVMEKKNFNKDNFHFNHPGGNIGLKLFKIKDLMHTIDSLPIISSDTLMNDVVRIINEKKFGVAIVVDNKKLVGIITDGDLRRLFLKGIDFSISKAFECMTNNPLVIQEDRLAVEALKILKNNKITSLIIVNSIGEVSGLIHLHDLWKTGII